MQLDEGLAVSLLDDAGDDLTVEAAVASVDVLPDGAGELGLELGPVLLHEAFESLPPAVYLVGPRWCPDGLEEETDELVPRSVRPRVERGLLADLVELRAITPFEGLQ